MIDYSRMKDGHWGNNVIIIDADGVYWIFI